MLTLFQHLQPWHTLPIAVLDFETTGPDPRTCAPVELAIVRFENGEPVARWSTLINPGVPIPVEAAAIHGITDAMVESAIPVAMLASCIEVQAAELLRDAMPCGYHGHAFDRVILHRFSYDYQFGLVSMADWPWLDPLVMVRHVDRFVRGSGRHRLEAACGRRNIKIAGAHRAAADAEAAGRLLFHHDIRAALGDQTITEVLRRQLIRAAEQDRDFEAWKAKQPPQETQS